MSDEVLPQYVECLSEWDRHVSPERQETYVRAELARLRAEGVPLLYTALTRPFIEQRNLLKKVLREQGYMPRLRLRASAVPPSLDPQSRPLPQADRGKVLVAKVGTRGQAPPGGTVSDIEAARYTARRDAIVRSPEGLYRTVRVTHEARAYTLDDADAVLMQWGVGVNEKRYRKRGALDQWLVEEVPEPVEPSNTPPRAPSAQGTRRAA